MGGQYGEPTAFTSCWFSRLGNPLRERGTSQDRLYLAYASGFQFIKTKSYLGILAMPPKKLPPSEPGGRPGVA